MNKKTLGYRLAEIVIPEAMNPWRDQDDPMPSEYSKEYALRFAVRLTLAILIGFALRSVFW